MLPWAFVYSSTWITSLRKYTECNHNNTDIISWVDTEEIGRSTCTCTTNEDDLFFVVCEKERHYLPYFHKKKGQHFSVLSEIFHENVEKALRILPTEAFSHRFTKTTFGVLAKSFSAEFAAWVQLQQKNLQWCCANEGMSANGHDCVSDGGEEESRASADLYCRILPKLVCFLSRL